MRNSTEFTINELDIIYNALYGHLACSFFKDSITALIIKVDRIKYEKTLEKTNGHV